MRKTLALMAFTGQLSADAKNACADGVYWPTCADGFNLLPSLYIYSVFSKAIGCPLMRKTLALMAFTGQLSADAKNACADGVYWPCCADGVCLPIHLNVKF